MFVWAEIEAIEQHYAVYGEYPADVQQWHEFYARHGRWPVSEAELDACHCAAGWDR